MRKAAWTLVLAFSMVTVFAPSALAGHSVSETYDASAIGIRGSAADLNVGGVLFPADVAQGQTPDTLEISDASGGPVAWTACQDIDGDAQCGNDEAEVSMSGCSSEADLSEPESGSWDPSAPIQVFVSTVDPGCPGAVATTGTVTLGFAG